MKNKVLFPIVPQTFSVSPEVSKQTAEELRGQKQHSVGIAISQQEPSSECNRSISLGQLTSAIVWQKIK